MKVKIKYKLKHIKVVFYFIVVLSVLYINASVGVAQNPDACQGCHGNEYYVSMDESAHKNLDCLSCHPGFTAFPHPEQQVSGDELCGTCHGSVYLEYQESVHGQMGFGCNECHEGAHEIKATVHRDSRVHRLQEPETCARCHAGTVPYISYRDSFHGIGNYFGSEKNATCSDCHSAHLILNEDPRSSVHPDNVAETCAVCHGVAAKGFAQGREHFVIERTGYSAPMYWTLKFFTWLTIIVISLLIIHMLLELYRRLLNIGKERT